MGALLGFLCSEAALRPSLWGNIGLKGVLWHDALWGMLFAGWVGIGLGVVEGVSDRSWGKARRGLLVGAMLGAGAGMVGVPMAELLFQWGLTVGGGAMLPRALGWAIVGGAAGIVQGAVRNSASMLWHGLFGGVLGGAAGGMVFEAVVGNSESEILARLLGLLALGLALGFSVGLVQEAFKQAWLTAVSGRAEGRTYFLDKPVTSIGSHEMCDIKVFGDPLVAARHAEIRQKGGIYEVTDVAGGGQVAVNLRPVKSSVLGDGFLLQVGGQRFVMQIRGAPAPFTQAITTVLQSAQRSPQGGPALAERKAEEGICPFCGGRKDPLTGACACTPTTTVVRDEGPGVEEGARAEGPVLVGVAGVVAGRQFQLQRPMTLIGRHSNNDITLTDDATISRFHARVARGPQGVVIYDEGSSNGTFVNGERVYQRVLRPGDVITVGKASFRFENTGNGGAR